MCHSFSLKSQPTSDQFLLSPTAHKYNCMFVTITQVPENFAQKLRASLDSWKGTGTNGVWLTIPIDNSELIPIAVQEGFIFHHAKENKLVLTKWLSDAENYMPAYATRTVGAWALVIDDCNRILVVKEKYNTEWGYKFPSGAVLMGEDFTDAAIRETKEETGIDTILMGVIAWVERHNTRMDDVSDISFICLLQPISTQIQSQESEISQAIWMPYEEFKEIAQGPQKEVLAAYEVNKKGYRAYACQDFAGFSQKDMMLYAPSEYGGNVLESSC